ncbi:MAG: PadR family transcriptional regulator, regulatory protein PadR [Clostridiales bacterium]|jgi:PadR family transcriptional regulator PadR|nr:PadR family transcriptional regulator, regulatory protein PadR [Clostridiales bacterium]
MFEIIDIESSMNLITLRILMEGDKNGYEVAKEIFHLTDGNIELKEESIYPILHKLEKRGLVKGYWIQEEGVPGKKYYRLTDKGKNHLKEEKKNGYAL